MQQFQIETAQNVSIAQNTAHLGERMLAYIIDSFVITVYMLLAMWLLAAMEVDFDAMWAIYLILTLPALVYYLLLETFLDGQTVGKGIMGIRVVKIDGSKPTFASYFVRWILRVIDITLSTGGVAVLTILLRGKGQRVGDIAAGTTVISEKKRMWLQDTLLREIPDDYSPRFPQVTVLKDRDIQTIKELFDKARRNGEHHIIVSLSDRIKEVTQIVTDLKPIEFVDIVIKDYNYYTQRL